MDIFNEAEAEKLTIGVKFTNAEEYKNLIDDVREKYEALQKSIKRLNSFQLEYKIV